MNWFSHSNIVDHTEIIRKHDINTTLYRPNIKYRLREENISLMRNHVIPEKITLVRAKQKFGLYFLHYSITNHIYDVPFILF